MQVNYLIDEVVNTGKGANNKHVSPFSHNSQLRRSQLTPPCRQLFRPEQELCHAVSFMAGLVYKKITLSFYIVGHTKFSPD